VTGLYVKTDFEVQMKIFSIQILILNVIVILPDTFVKITKMQCVGKQKRSLYIFLKLNMT